MKINKFWAKMKMAFVGIGVMSILSFTIGMMSELLEIKVSYWLFLCVAFLAAIVASYSNHRRILELKEETK